MRRVVITGIGMVTSSGDSVPTVWNNVVEGRSSASLISGFDTTGLPVKIANEIKWKGTDFNTNDTIPSFDPNVIIDPQERRRMDNFSVYALYAATEAINDSGLSIKNEEEADQAGVIIGSGIGGFKTIEDSCGIISAKNYRKLSPFFLTSVLTNMASGLVSIKYNLKGPNLSIVSACASGAHAIGDSSRLIRTGEANVMIAGGTEAVVCPFGISSFSAMRALSTRNDEPTKASRPWDKDRDGFVMGEGAGIVVLEEYEHAKARGAKIYAEIIGYGMSGDANHIVAPSSDGDGANRAMKRALSTKGIGTEDIDYINAHGTSTPLGDEIEVIAIERLFANSLDKLAVSSTKSVTGHLLGAAGAIETIFTVMAMKNSVVPPTINLDTPFEGCKINLVPHTAQEKNINIAMSNSFGFGGCNASLIFQKI